MIELYTHQRQAIDNLYQWFYSHSIGNPLLIMPTGSGKSVVIAALICEALAHWPKTRVLVLTHVKELIEQNAQRLLAMWPNAPIGIHSAGLRRKDAFEPIIFAGIQSVWKKAWHIGSFDLILIDEVHLVSHKAEGTYRHFLNECRAINPRTRIIGLTATPFRTGHGSIMEGEDPLFHGVAHEIKMLELIEKGFLAPLVSKRMATTIDVSGVQIKQGEYVASQLERAVDQDSITQAALDECQQYGADRKKWLVFCAGVAHAEHVATAMNARGIATGCVTGKTPSGERDRLIEQYRRGQLRALTNANVLTTGFDVPDTDMLVMLRPTQSPGLFVQMVGRVSRIAPGKESGIVLDFAGNTLRHGPVDQIEAWTPRPSERDGEAPSKTCPDCETIVATAVRECPECGYQFPFETKKHEAVASSAPILSSDLAPRLERHPVHHVEYRYWPGKDGKPPTLKVTYCGPLVRLASEWICFEHQGYARSKAVTWWMNRAPGSLVPKTIDEAEQRAPLELRVPTAITIDVRPKYPEIKAYEWSESDARQAA